MSTFIKRIWDEFDNASGPALYFCAFFAWGLPIVLIGSAAFLIWELNPIVTAAVIIINLVVLYYGSFPRMRGVFTGFEKFIFFGAAILEPYWFFTTLLVYFLTVAPVLTGLRRYNTVAFILLFIFNPLSFVLFVFGLLFSGASDVFSLASLQKWRRANCSSCNKPMKAEVLIRNPLCGACLARAV